MAGVATDATPKPRPNRIKLMAAPVTVRPMNGSMPMALLRMRAGAPPARAGAERGAGVAPVCRPVAGVLWLPRRSGGGAGGDDGDQRGQLFGRRVSLDDLNDRLVHRGMFPCFLGGRVSRLVRSRRRARMISARVSLGLITASTYPRSAATYGLARWSSYSVISC